MKTKSILFVVFYSLTYVAFAQFYPTSAYYYYWPDTKQGKPLKFGTQAKQANVQSYQIAYLNQKGVIRDRYVYELNQLGNVVLQSIYKRSGDLKQQIHSTYLNDTLLTGRVTINKDGDTTSKVTYTFEWGRLVKTKSVRGKKISEYVNTYNENGNRTSYQYIKNGQVKYSVKYEYDETGKLMKQLTYNQQNKLTAVINYTCNYQGETQKKVDQSKICQRKDVLPNGGYVVYNDFTNPKGRLIRTVSTYNSDSNLVQVQTYNTKNKLTSVGKYNYDINGNCIQYNYTQRNRLNQFTYTYNEKNLLVEYTTRKQNQLHNSVKYSYVYRQ